MQLIWQHLRKICKKRDHSSPAFSAKMGSQSRSFKSSSSLVLIETAWCRHSCKGADTDSKPEMHCSKPFFPAPTLFLNFFFCHCQHEIEETHFTGGGQRSYDEDGSSTKRWLAKWDSCNAISWICNVAPALSSWHHSSRVIRSMSESVCRHPKVSSTAAVIFSTLVIESIIVSLYVPLTDTRVDAWCKLKFIISASTITALASPVIDAVSDLGFSLSLTLIWSFSDLNCPNCPVCSSSSSSNSSSLNFNLPPCTTAVRQKKWEAPCSAVPIIPKDVHCSQSDVPLCVTFSRLCGSKNGSGSKQDEHRMLLNVKWNHRKEHFPLSRHHMAGDVVVFFSAIRCNRLAPIYGIYSTITTELAEFPATIVHLASIKADATFEHQLQGTVNQAAAAAPSGPQLGGHLMGRSTSTSRPHSKVKWWR